MADERRGDLLRHIPLFARLAPEQIAALGQATRRRRLRAREELFHKGDEGAEVYVIVSGRLKVGTTSLDGADVVLNIMDPGEVFGDLALLAGGRRTGTVTALDAAELLVLDRRSFLQFLRAEPEVAIQLLALLAERLIRVSELVEDTVFLSLPSRLAKKLVYLSDSYGADADDGTRISLRLSQTELGNMVGVSRESVNKQIRAWTDEGVLTMDRGQVTIHDLPALERLAGLLVR